MSLIWNVFSKTPPTPPPPPPPPPPQPEFDKPWREMPWKEKLQLEQKIRDFKVGTTESSYIRILIVGEVGAGKSSFINSVNNVFQRRITCSALTDIAGSALTKMYKTYYIEEDDGSHLAFVFNDIIGLQKTYQTLPLDIIKALQGFVHEGYTFNPACSLTEGDHGYRRDPSLEQQTFCLVYVMAASTVSLMHSEVIQHMKWIRQAATELNVPQVIIMTKPDEACPLVTKDIRNIYKSKKIKEKMQECSNLLGVTMNHIFPVKNYHQEIDPVNDMDVLILKALDQIVNIANDALVTKTSEQVEKLQLDQKIRDFKVGTTESPYVRILIVGDVGAGKSSFINSVNNAIQQRITCSALTDATAGTAFTKRYKTHYIRKADGSHLAFVFNDIMGLQKTYETLPLDIIKALKGFVHEGYKFNPECSLTERDHGYRRDPSLEQQTFCLVYVMAANTVSLMHSEVIEQMKRIRQAATLLNVPQVIIITKPDEACPLVTKDIRNIYKSKKIKEKMQECSNLLGVTINHIFPVKNYHQEIDPVNDMDVLILKALDHIVNIANDVLVTRTSEQV